jgi:hypothetical protein
MDNSKQYQYIPEPPLMKPTVKQVEEYMAGLNGMTKEDYNVISKPKHYMLFESEGIEVRHVIEKLVCKFKEDELTELHPLFISDYVQLMQYLMRFMDKNGVEDLKKARVYLNWMIEAYE